jgi:hypothetical protein
MINNETCKVTSVRCQIYKSRTGGKSIPTPQSIANYGVKIVYSSPTF